MNHVLDARKPQADIVTLVFYFKSRPDLAPWGGIHRICPEWTSSIAEEYDEGDWSAIWGERKADDPSKAQTWF